MNARSGEEVCIPRMFLGEVSGVEEAVMIVGLNRELEWREGAIIPQERRVIELPVAVNDSRHTAASSGAHLAPVINIRLEPKPEGRAWKWLGVAFVLGAVATTIVANIAWQSQPRQRPDLFRTYRPWLELNANDDYVSTIHRMGTPSAVRITRSGDAVFQSLVYEARRYSVILAGRDKESARYVGTIDTRGHVLDAVRLTNGLTSESLLHSPALR